MIYTVGAIVVLGVLLIGFLSGRKYERKQFVYIGKKKPTTQDILLGGKND